VAQAAETLAALRFVAVVALVGQTA
jgi:hypothetical protein